ncbi:hypothetical protein B0H16DRAFT_1473893 [Mycena metata]|uniref:Uncharacterized protein n=1 Tax=Mycena metata TaxID=1033252 RepID=A0AAD7HJD1_9AGAR|nr:hypothetical protein B0H16DRAFT_1473893 [Mycena metata]
MARPESNGQPGPACPRPTLRYTPSYRRSISKPVLAKRSKINTNPNRILHIVHGRPVGRSELPARNATERERGSSPVGRMYLGKLEARSRMPDLSSSCFREAGELQVGFGMHTSRGFSAVERECADAHPGGEKDFVLFLSYVASRKDEKGKANVNVNENKMGGEGGKRGRNTGRAREAGRIQLYARKPHDPHPPQALRTRIITRRREQARRHEVASLREPLAFDGAVGAGVECVSSAGVALPPLLSGRVLR